jgi:hypothetical protein
MAKEKPQQGEVLAVGPGKRDETGNLAALGIGDHYGGHGRGKTGASRRRAFNPTH